MSLLLDALKKAAQDKQKAASEAPAATTPDPSLEFDLEQVETSQSSVIEESPRAVADELPELSANITPPESDIHHAAQPEILKPAKTENPPVTLAMEDVPVQKAIPEKIEVAAPEIVESRPADKKIESVKIQSAAARPQEALDMMINKSRHAHEKQQTMQRAGLIVLVVVLLLSAGTYFYMQSSDEYLPPQTVLAAPETETPAVVETPQQPQTVAVASPVTTVVHQSRAPRANKPRHTDAVTQSIEPAPVQFSKKTQADPIEDLLSRAYEKFNAGDYVGANDLYQQVLQREPDNRDGLLGVAAVAVKQQRNEYARQKYLQLLQLDPKDSLARAGLATVAGDAQDETQLKLMLREQPDAPHLYFALGSVYASQQRWSEAQQAFFSAWSGDSNNADYAYNLGVSLDRMGKFKAAAAQYQIALQLHQKRAGNFIAADVDARIQAIGNMTDE